MLIWLARAAVQAREGAQRKQVHVAASADRDQSSIYRFEQNAKGDGKWPRDTDRIVAAYADDLEMRPIDLWQTALDMWRDRLSEEETRPPGQLTGALGQRPRAALKR